MNEKLLNELLTWVGSLAELSAVFFGSLTDKDVPSAEAAVITGKFVESIVKSK